MSDNNKQETSFELISAEIDQAIEAKRHQTSEMLDEVEKHFQTLVQSHIDYHKYLMEQAKKKDEMQLVDHHRALMETYEAIIKNYSMSKL